MKIIVKTIIISIALVLITTNINANSNKNELNFEYGQFTIPQGAYIFGGILGAAFSLGHFSFENTVVTGSFNFGYNRNVNDWFGYGGLTSFEYITSDTYSVDNEGNKKPNGKFNMGVITLMPTTHFFWFRHPHFGMYSKLGAGIGLVFNDETSVIPAFQLSPVCMEFGGNKYKGIFELGVGTQGIAILGIKRIF